MSHEKTRVSECPPTTPNVIVEKATTSILDNAIT